MRSTSPLAGSRKLTTGSAREQSRGSLLFWVCRLPLSAAVPIRVNRAPVLTLWASIVAERLGYPPFTSANAVKMPADQ
jgi:hypothetical protein